MNTDQLEPTIAAIATPPGHGGIGIVRLSGSTSSAILHSLFKKSGNNEAFLTHHIYHGWIVRPADHSLVDEVLAVYMAAPRSYTREDVVEIQCHGGPVVLGEILRLVIEAGAVPAAAGEFTKRAFLNGRIDLTQAEAVAELLGAKTRQAMHLAAEQLHGRLHQEVISIRETLLNIRALLEVAIDFPEDEDDILDSQYLAVQIKTGALQPIAFLVQSANRGKIYRDGISVVILGRPNVGKSSLLNALLREERAIVTPIPGTTRDTIEEYLDVRGIPVRLIDTAGIRECFEAVEEIGIQRARRKQEEADLVLLMIDLTVPLSKEDKTLFESLQGKSVILVANKRDLLADYTDFLSQAKALFPGTTVVPLSAKTLDGLEELEEAIFQQSTGAVPVASQLEHICVPNLRQKAQMEKALQILNRAVEGLTSSVAPDLLAIDLQEALDCLSEIIGESTNEDILDLIFSKFCIGK